MAGVVKPEGLLSVTDAKKLTPMAVADLMARHMSPGQLELLRMLAFDRILVHHADGMYYVDQNGRRILDFFGAFGALAFGHNHPRILAARRAFAQEHRHELAIAFMSQYAAALSYDLARVAPGDLDMVFLCLTGSEAVEAALKLAERACPKGRRTVAFAERSFHGKTRGALSVTDSRFYQADFALLNNCRRVPFGDVDALERLFLDDPTVGTFIVETVQCGAGIVMAPDGYWAAVRQLCDRYGVLWIADEVQCGYGRTGRFFAFEHYGVVPDIVTLAKSLGGGKAAMGAYIARTPVFIAAYGTPETALIHGPATFSGMGEACVTAIESLHTLYDEALIDNAATQGRYLLECLQKLRMRYPRMIHEVRGLGCMVGLEMCDLSQSAPLGMRTAASLFDGRLKGGLAGLVGALLLHHHDVLVGFTEYNRNVIRLEPPLVVQRHHVDRFVESLDQILSGGIARIATDYLRVKWARPVPAA